MTDETSFAAQLAKSTGKDVKTKTANSVRRKPKNKEVPSIQSNAFAKIVMENADPSRQKSKMAELMVFKDPETTAANKAALNEYTAYMQAERQRLALQLIEATDTETFSNMQKVLMDINGGVLDFEEQIKPFMEIINAVRLIQEEDATTEILSEMRKDKEAVEDLENKIKDINAQMNSKVDTIYELKSRVDSSKLNRSFFGFGSIKSEAAESIILDNKKILELSDEVAELRESIAELKSNKREESTKFAHLSDAKKIMATMLDLSGGEHEERHKKLISTASEFVTTTKERVADTLSHSVKMGSQITELSNLAFTMRGSYSVLAEAAKEAEVINSQAHEKVKEEIATTENALEKMSKEKISRDLSKHITSLNDSVTETSAVISDLTISSQRIETMEAANLAQIKKTEQIQTSGIAGVADNLSSVLTAINQAAIGQSSTAATQSLRRMNDTTIELTKEGMLNAAKNQNEDNAALVKSLIQLTGFGDVIDLTNEAATAALEENRELISELNEAADAVSQSAAATLEIQSSINTDEVGQ